MTTFAGTEEVIQSTRISNDNAAIDKMVEEGNKNDITYIKSPAGIFTELTIPVDEILNGHENDTINSARISLTRINNTKHEKYNLDIPTTLLLIPNDMRTSFFEEGKIPDNVQTYTAVFATSDQSSLAKQNSYTFHNVANLIAYMSRKRSEGIKEYEGKECRAQMPRLCGRKTPYMEQGTCHTCRNDLCHNGTNDEARKSDKRHEPYGIEVCERLYDR